MKAHKPSYFHFCFFFFFSYLAICTSFCLKSHEDQEHDKKDGFIVHTTSASPEITLPAFQSPAPDTDICKDKAMKVKGCLCGEG